MFKIVRIDFNTGERIDVQSHADRTTAFNIVILANKATRANDADYYYTVVEPA